MARPRLEWSIVLQKRQKKKDGQVVGKYKPRYRIFYWSGDDKKELSTAKPFFSRYAANDYCRELKEKGFFSMSPLFQDFARGFFDPNSEYVKDRIERSKPLGEQYRLGLASNLELLLREFEGYTVRQLDTSFLDAWFLSKYKEGKKTNTLNNYKKALAPVFDSATEKGLIQANPLKNLKSLGISETTKKAFSNYTIYSLLQQPKNDFYFLALTSLSMGGRIGEVQALQVKHVEKESDSLLWVTIEQTYQHNTKEIGPPKAESYRTVPLMGPAVPFIISTIQRLHKQFGDNYKEAYIFSPTGKMEDILDQTKANKFLAKAYTSIHNQPMGKEFTFHSLRRWFNSRALILNNHNEFFTKIIMGHRQKGNMTGKYNTVSRETFTDWISNGLPNLFGEDKEFLQEQAKQEIIIEDDED